MPDILLRSVLGEKFTRNGYFFQLTHSRPLLASTHCHDFYEIICLISGSCIHAVNEIEYPSAEGDVFILRPADRHSFRAQAENTNVAALSVLTDEIEKFRTAYGLADDKMLDEAPADRSALRFSLSRPELTRISETCSRLFALPISEQPPLCRIFLGNVFAGLIRSRDRAENSMPPSFSAIICEMNSLSNAAAGVEAFLQISNFSHAQLCRLTKRYLGLTPGEYVNSIRMKYAWELVIAGEEDFGTICEKVGFSSFSYFCRLFEKTFGISPSKARKSRFSGGRTV